MYKLVIINHVGARTGLYADPAPDELIDIGKRLFGRFPDERYVVIDSNGAIVWPAA